MMGRSSNLQEKEWTIPKTGRERRTERPFVNVSRIIYHFYETSPNCSLRANEILRYSEKGEKQTMQRKKW